MAMAQKWNWGKCSLAKTGNGWGPMDRGRLSCYAAGWSAQTQRGTTPNVIERRAPLLFSPINCDLLFIPLLPAYLHLSQPSAARNCSIARCVASMASRLCPQKSWRASRRSLSAPSRARIASWILGQAGGIGSAIAAGAGAAMAVDELKFCAFGTGRGGAPSRRNILLEWKAINGPGKRGARSSSHANFVARTARPLSPERPAPALRSMAILAMPGHGQDAHKR